MTWPVPDRLAVNPPLTSSSQFVDLSSFSDFLRRKAPDLLPTRAALAAAGANAVDSLPHGTTIVALKYPGGVVIAGDRRSTQGHMIAGRDVQKVYITDDYTATNLLLANKFLGPDDSMTAGRLWFVEVVVWILVALAVLCWLPIVDRVERRWPFGFAMAFLMVGIAFRYDVFGFGLGHGAWFTVLAFWFFAAGWAAAKATWTWQRLAVTVVLAVAVVGYFGNPQRELLVFTGLALVTWLPTLRCPAALTVVAGVIAEASLFTYLVHYQVYPLFGSHQVIGVAASILAGVLLTRLVTLVRGRIRDRRLASVSPVAEAPVRR